MAVTKPSTLNELGNIMGVGQSKLTKYGDMFLEAMNG
jgi:superfamily II DNA helicase RecQ